MLSFISCFFPAVISIYVKDKKKKLTYKELCFNYVFYNLLINVGVLFAIALSNHFDTMLIVFTPVFTLKYLLMAVTLAILIPFVEQYLRNNISISIKKGPTKIKGSKNK